MGSKGKPSRKRRIDASDDEDTFINNSDYNENSVSGAESDQNTSRSFEDASQHQQTVESPTHTPRLHSRSNDSPKADTSIRDRVLSVSKSRQVSKESPNESVREASEDPQEPSSSNQEDNIAQKIESADSEMLRAETPDADPNPNEALRPNDQQIKIHEASEGTPTKSPPIQTIALVSPKKKSLDLKPPVSTGPRLVIKKLVLTNFKSYAGVQEIGPFNASFSAVVGPNGSGKSNVIDSMLFVFGFRALKMRQGKLSELIHNSDGDKSIEYCQVDIHFAHVIDDPYIHAKSTEVEGSELVISRRAFKSNGSQYYLNGRNSTYTEVTGFLRGQGIDLDHKRFLILQGEVESIAQMKSKAEKEGEDGLLEYLEDIIGTSKYKPLIDEGLVKVEELNQVCLEKESRFELVENDANALEETKIEALKFLKMEKSLTDKRSIKHQISIHDTQKKLDKYEKEVTQISDKLAAEDEKNKKLGDSIEKVQREKSAIKERMDSLTRELATTTKKQKSINSQVVSLEEKLKNVQNKIKKIEKTKSTSESALSSSTMKLENLKASEDDLKTNLETLQNSLDKEKSILAKLRTELKQKTSHLSEEILQLQIKLEPFNDELKAKEGQVELINSELEMLETQKINLNDKIKDTSKRLVDIKAEGKAKEAELEALEGKLQHIDDQIELGDEQCKSSRKNLEGKRVRLASARTKTRDAVNSLSNLQNRNKVLTELMKLHKSGRISDFYGRLGDLGEIDDKYDIAISTACPALDSFVVETTETAGACLEYLRSHKLGTAYIVVLEQVRRNNLNMRPIQTPGNPSTVRRLFDLITPKDKKFLPAFYSKLRDTLVASNLQEARSVAHGPKRFRVVTLDGKIVDSSGTMSGGGNNFSKGVMQLKSKAVSLSVDYSEEDVDQMKEELVAMEQEVEEMNLECYNMENNLRKLKELKPETEFKIQALQLDIKALVNEKKEVSATLKALIVEKEQQDASAELESAISQKQQQLKKVIEEQNALKLQMVDSETEIARLEEKIMEAGGVELKLQNSKVDSIKQQIEILVEKSSGDQVSMKKLANDIKRHSKIISDGEAELEATSAEVAEFEAASLDRKQQLKELVTEIDKIQIEINGQESELEKVEESLEELNAKINEFKSEEIELRNQLEKLQGIIKRYRRDIASLEEALQGTVVRDTAPYIDWMPEDERKLYSTSNVEQLTEDEMKNVDLDQVEEEIEELEKYMNDVKVDVEVLKEYGIKQKDLELRRTDLNQSVEERDSVRSNCENLKRKRLDEFMEGFNTISLSLKVMYQMITMGGNAELELVDSLDPFSEGILFSVMPPKKSWKNISNLSGGEKTLSSLALVFALHKYKPTPLYVMDEIDAALDFRNVSIVANYIKERTKNAQFIVISLRNNMFELAQQLVGIYKVSNRTRSISLQNKDLLLVEN